MWNQIIVESCLTFPVNMQWFRVLGPCLAATKRLPLDTWNQSGVQENFFGNQFSTFDSPRDHSQRIQSEDVQRNQEAVPEAGRMKTIHASEDTLNQGTIPMPTFAEKPWTTSSTMLVEWPQNYMVIQQRQQISEVQFDKFLNPQTFFVWKILFTNQVTTWFRFSIGCYVVDEGNGDGRFFGRDEILPISLWQEFSKLRDAGREDCLCSEQDHPKFPVQKEGQSGGAGCSERGPFPSRKTNRLHDPRLLSSDWRSWHSTGLCWFILCYSSWWQYSGIRYKMGWSFTIYVKDFIRWYPGKSVHIEDTRVWSTQKTVLELYDMEIHQKISMPNYQKLKTMVKRSVDQKLRLRNSDARHGTFESGAVVKNPKGLISVEGRKGICYQWKEKDQSSQGDRCTFRYKTQDRAHKPEHTTATPSRSKCIEEEVSGAKVTMGPFFDNRADIIWEVPARERLVNIGIRPSANSIKVKRVVRLETSVCFRITRLLNNPIKSRRRATCQKQETAMTRILWLLWNVYHNWVVNHKIQMHWILKVEGLGETRRRVYATSSGYPGKERTIVGKINAGAPHQRSHHAVKFEDWSHEETERQQRCARSKAWNPAKTYTISKKKIRLHSTVPRRNGYSRLRQQRSREEREFVVDSGASLRMVSKKNISPSELETMRTSRRPTTVMTANGEVQTREEATVYVKQLDLFVTGMLLQETPAVLSMEKLREDHGFSYHWTSGQKPHISRNCKRIDCKKSNYVPCAVPGLSASSSSTTPSPTSPSSSWQDSVFDVNIYTEYPVPERNGSTTEELRGNPLHESTETQNKIKNVNQKKYKKIYCMNCLIGYRNSERIWLMKVLQQSLGETQSKEVETLPSPLMNFQWSR